MTRATGSDPASLVAIIEALVARDLIGLVDHVCRARGVTREDVCGRGRTKGVALARHELWWHLRHHPDLKLSYEEIGRLFERHHSTVLDGVRAHDRSRPTPITAEVRSATPVE